MVRLGLFGPNYPNSSNHGRLLMFFFAVGTEVIREKVQDGETGETREISYTQCKIVGNGSFGVVFQTRMMPSNEDAAIKRVLQDKRFKVCPGIVDFTTTAVTKEPQES